MQTNSLLTKYKIQLVCVNGKLYDFVVSINNDNKVGKLVKLSCLSTYNRANISLGIYFVISFI